MRKRNPKSKHFTEQQEKDMERSEQLHCKARIYKLGVKGLLNETDYFSSDLEVCIEVLKQSQILDKQAYALKAGVDK